MNPRSSDGIADYFESAGSTDNVVPTVNTTQQQQASFEPGLVSAPAANSRSVSPSPAGVLQPISMMASRDTDFVAYGAPLQIDINRQEYFTTLQDGSISNANKLTEKSLGQSGLIDRFQAFLIDDASTGVSVYADASNVEHPYVSRYNDTEGLIAKHQSAFENENTESAIEEVRMTRTGDGLPAFQPGDELAELVGSRSDNSQSSVSDESISPFQIAVFRHADETGPLQLVSELQKRQDISRDDFVFRDDEESVQKSGYFAIIPPAESTLIFAGILATTWYREEKSEKPNDGGNATGPNSGPPG